MLSLQAQTINRGFLSPVRSMLTRMPARRPLKPSKTQFYLHRAEPISLQAGLRVRSRHPMDCTLFPYSYPDPKPCFDLSTVLVEFGNKCHEKIIRSFLYTHYWPREPSTVSMYMPLCSPYLAVLTERYATSGDRFLAFEIQPRTKERRPVGVVVANKVFPWVADEYEEWAHHCSLTPERNSMYFRAHCIRHPDIFKKYHIPYAYDIEVLATSSDVTGQGVALLLLRTVILRALELRHPLIQIVSKSEYTHKLCTRVGMKKEWEMDYSEFIDMTGKSVFYPRTPHKKVALFARRFSEVEGSVVERCFEPQLYEVYEKRIIGKKQEEHKHKRCDITKASKFPPECT